MKVKTNDEFRAIQSMRNRPEAKLLRVIIGRELDAARDRFESTAANEDNRAIVDAHKVIFDKFFTDAVELEKS